jgi:GT2 family glycosyltransferase
VSCTAAIVNWNSGALLRSCIESLLNTSTDAEILVVDNASTDDSAVRALDFRDRVNFIRNNANRGLAAAINHAFAATATDYVLVLNPDLRVLPGAVSYLETWMDRHPDAGAIGGYVNEKYLPRRLPSVGSLVLENVGAHARVDANSSSEPVVAEQPAGAALMIRRQAYNAIGGFDEQFFPAWYEDVDFCRRLESAGWKLYFAPQAKFVHEGGYSANALGPADFAAAYYRNQLRYARKHFGDVASVIVRVSIAAGMIGRMALRPARLRAYWGVFAGVLGGW